MLIVVYEHRVGQLSIIDERDKYMAVQSENAGMRIPFISLKNTRDLGGYKTEDGRQILPRRLLRGEALHGAAREDRAMLLETYHLQMVIDLRTALEAEQKPDPVLPGVKAVFNPILDEATAGFTRENRDEDPLKSFMKHAEALKGDPEIYTRQLYRDLILNRQAMERYEHFLRLLAEADSGKGAILWHCSAGKDRAGMATAFLLLAFGVSRETVVEDFVRTNEFLREETQRKIQRIRELGGSEETARSAAVLSQVKRSYIETAFQTAEDSFGSLELYLEKQLGLTKVRRNQLRDQYLL